MAHTNVDPADESTVLCFDMWYQALA